MDAARRANALALGIVLVMVAGACTSPPHRSMDGGGATSLLPARASAGSAPRFAADGPEADDYGAREGYPVKAIFRDRFFVGLFSHYDQILEGRVVPRALTPSPLNRALLEPPVRYEYQGKDHTLDDYLGRNPATGLLIARGDAVLIERYQYARNERHRFASFSMPRRSPPC